jgi:hydroxymethylpyrimidine/phosphomethylpyrimidine kinase
LFCDDFPVGRTEFRPTALSIAGSDSGGGAGIQADLRTFALLGLHGATAITCLTAQNRQSVARIEPASPAMLRAQLQSVFAETAPPRAAKTGMLYSAAIVDEVAQFWKKHPRVPLVVDPVMIATSGRRLLQSDAVEVLRRELLPLAALVTPNRDEAEVLSGWPVRSPEQMREAARRIAGEYGCATLVKGGHVGSGGVSLDILFDKGGEWLLSAPRARGVRLHGTGCAYSAAIVAGLALGKPLLEAVEDAKQFITDSIHGGRSVSR